MAGKLNLTPKRIAYLERLIDGPKPRDGKKGKTGFDLMQAGLIEWDFRAGGEPISREEYRARIKSDSPREFPGDAERLTPAGRRALAAKESAQ